MRVFVLERCPGLRVGRVVVDACWQLWAFVTFRQSCPLAEVVEFVGEAARGGAGDDEDEEGDEETGGDEAGSLEEAHEEIRWVNGTGVPWRRR